MDDDEVEGNWWEDDEGPMDDQDPSTEGEGPPLLQPPEWGTKKPRLGRVERKKSVATPHRARRHA